MMDLERIRERKPFFYAAGVFFLFLAGFFILFGREAAVSGSWKFVMIHDDEYRYWVDTRNIAEKQFEDNPFYFEELGRVRPFPQPVSWILGKLAKGLRVSVLFFFPVWHIVMPWILWLAVFLCLNRLWGYPRGASAAFSLFVLLATLYLRGQAMLTLTRFARPIDALWLVFIWISFLMNPSGKPTGPRRPWALGLLGAVILWFNPFLGFLLPILSGLEALWQTLIVKNVHEARKHWLVFLLLTAACLGYALWVIRSLPQDSWLYAHTLTAAAKLRYSPFSSAVLYVLILILTAGYKWISKRPFSILDRLTMFVFIIEPLFTLFEIFMPARRDWTGHQYHFFLIEIFCLAGCLWEKRGLVTEKISKRAAVFLGAALVLLQGMILADPKIRFIYIPHFEHPPYAYFNNSLHLLMLLPALLSLLLLFAYVPRFTEAVRRPSFIIPFLVFFGLTGFALYPSQMRRANQSFPYEGAYEWLDQNAAKDSVLLTASALHTHVDYALLYTPCRVFVNRIGDQATRNDEGVRFRNRFLITLLLGHFNDATFLGSLSPEEKLKNLRLDYIAAARNGPFVPPVTRQLGNFLEEVYQDEKSVLWKVEKRGQAAF